ncbi:MAG: hypothetical protein R3B45_05735 [Bdellovibrionota bacterium]
MGKLTLRKYIHLYSQTHRRLYIIGPLFSASEAKQSNFSGAVIFVDGGVRFRKSDEGFSVGDGDSSEVALDKVLNTEKDFSDLSYVFDHLEDYFEEVVLLGFLGGRRDHELANLAEAHRFLSRRNLKVRLLFDQEVIGLSKGEWQVSIDSIFTLFSFEAVHLDLRGACKYQTSGFLRHLSSHGLSNEGYGKVAISCDHPVFVFTS